MTFILYSPNFGKFQAVHISEQFVFTINKEFKLGLVSTVKDEHIPGRQQGGAIDLLGRLQELGVTRLLCPIHRAFQEQL